MPFVVHAAKSHFTLNKKIRNPEQKSEIHSSLLGFHQAKVLKKYLAEQGGGGGASSLFRQWHTPSQARANNILVSFLSVCYTFCARREKEWKRESIVRTTSVRRAVEGGTCLGRT